MAMPRLNRQGGSVDYVRLLDAKIVGLRAAIKNADDPDLRWGWVLALDDALTEQRVAVKHARSLLRVIVDNTK